jgi:predicted flavoprotein YhiN
MRQRRMMISNAWRIRLAILAQTLIFYRLCIALSAPFRVAVIGAGSSGIFATLSFLDTVHNEDGSFSTDLMDIKVYESTNDVLRCVQNHHQSGVLFDTSKQPMEILKAGYPRGRKEITSLLTKYFPPTQQQTWFEDRGITFTARQDGTMTYEMTSDGLCNAILQDRLREVIETQAKVSSISKDRETRKFHLTFSSAYNKDRIQMCDCVILATGNSQLGHQLAKSLGHTIATPVRSCFEFMLNGTSILSNLEKGSVYNLPFVRLSYKVKIEGQKQPRIFKSEGSAQLQVHNHVVTLTGVAASSLSSLAAFELKCANYKGTLLVHFCPDHFDGKVEKLEEYLWEYRQGNPNKLVGEHCPLINHFVDYDDYDWETESFKTTSSECIPADLWKGLTEECGVAHGSLWSKMSPKKVRSFAEAIVGCPFKFFGRSTATAYPFINAGGVTLRDIDMSTMKSKVVDGLFCCGQVLDGDASHGTYSFMRSFATGKLAGESAAVYAKQRSVTTEVNQV